MNPPPPITARRAGFSLIEALIVLVVAGAALMLIFSVGIRSTEIAFRLGRRALDVADRQVSSDALRTIVRGLEISPTGSTPRGDAVVTGDARTLSGPTVLSAATPCAGAGPARVTVRLEHDAAGDILTCQAGAGPARRLADLRPRRAAFSYSEDGVSWRSAWRADEGALTAPTTPRERSVHVRLATDDGWIEIVERATSGRPALHPAPPVSEGLAQ